MNLTMDLAVNLAWTSPADHMERLGMCVHIIRLIIHVHSTATRSSQSTWRRIGDELKDSNPQYTTYRPMNIEQPLELRNHATTSCYRLPTRPLLSIDHTDKDISVPVSEQIPHMNKDHFSVSTYFAVRDPAYSM